MLIFGLHNAKGRQGHVPDVLSQNKTSFGLLLLPTSDFSKTSAIKNDQPKIAARVKPPKLMDKEGYFRYRQEKAVRPFPQYACARGQPKRRRRTC